MIVRTLLTHMRHSQCSAFVNIFSLCCMKLIQPKCTLLFYFIVYLLNVCSSHPTSSPIFSQRTFRLRHTDFDNKDESYKIELDFFNAFPICALSFGIITLLWLSYLHLRYHIRFVFFRTNLSLLSKKKRDNL